MRSLDFQKTKPNRAGRNMRASAFGFCAALCLSVAPAALAQSASGGSDTLGRVLEQAKQRGLLVDRNGEEPPQMPDEQAPIADAPETTIAPLPPKPAYVLDPSCDAVTVLDFRALKGLARFDQVQKLASPEGGNSTPLNTARFYLSLGLGAEARAALGADVSEQASLLRHAAQSVESYSGSAPDEEMFSRYTDCSDTARLWALFDPLTGPVTGVQQREYIEVLADFPPHLGDRLALNVAIKNAERGDMNMAKAFWLLMENRALETGAHMPGDKTDDAHIYLQALLNLTTDTSYALGKLKYLSEKESTYRIPALKRIINVQAGKGLSAEQRAGLDDISLSTDDPVQIAQAAQIRVGMHVADNELIKAIDLAKDSLEEGSEAYVNLVQEIGSAVLTAINSQQREQKFQGLNSYYHDPVFFEAFEDLGGLEKALISAALSLGLPSLTHGLYEHDAEQDSAMTVLLAKATLMESLDQGEDIAPLSPDLKGQLPDSLIIQTARNALRRNDFQAAFDGASVVKDEAEQAQLFEQIYWAQAKWAQLAERFSDESVDTPQVVQLLAAPQLEAPIFGNGTSGAGINIAVGKYLTELNTAIDTATEYLDHG